MKYILGIDQSTQGTKAIVFDENGELKKRVDISHKQIISDNGWISHDLNEIYKNVLRASEKVIKESGIEAEEIVGIGISNQRETTAAWNKISGEPLELAIVWQCSRSAKICEEINRMGYSDTIHKKTGIELSPYFPSAKMAWLLKNCKNVEAKAKENNLCLGTIDSWLVYKLTGNKVFKTDYSNASRTQLFNIYSLKWDQEICEIFDVPVGALADITDSNGFFGETDLEGILPKKIPIHGVLGDSHGALFGQGCHEKGMTKVTYGTGSSVMMNTGSTPVISNHGLSTSIAWSMNGKVQYVLEGNINYAGAVIKWLQEDLELIKSPEECESLALQASTNDETCLVPAFSGLGAPYWESNAKAIIYGIGRNTGKREIVRAGLESIAFQIMDVLIAMEKDTSYKVSLICADGGASRNNFLMQFQSDITDTKIMIQESEELSCIGAAYACGIALGYYDEKNIHETRILKEYIPNKDKNIWQIKKENWKQAVNMILNC